MSEERHFEAGELRIEGGPAYVRIEKLSVRAEANEHARMEAVLLCESDTDENEEMRREAFFPVRLTAAGDVLFEGVCAELSFARSGERLEARIKASSKSVLSDVEKKSRSFQKVPIALGEFADRVYEAYEGVVDIVTERPGQEIKSLSIQTNETDFEFISKIARFCL